IVLVAGCVAQDANRSPSFNTKSVEQTGPQHSDLTGLWEGTSTADCSLLEPEPGRCNAVEKITLRIFQQSSTLTGHYTCAIGTMDCRNSNTDGTIIGKMTSGGAGLRVMLPDGSSCLFNGSTSHDKFAGVYFCMQGGGYIEKGRFEVQRSY